MASDDWHAELCLAKEAPASLRSIATGGRIVHADGSEHEGVAAQAS